MTSGDSVRKFGSLALLASLMLLAAQPASAQETGGAVSSIAPGQAGAATANSNYWTPERMKSAKPVPVNPPKSRSAKTSGSPLNQSPLGEPGARPGYNPDDDRGDMQKTMTFEEIQRLAEAKTSQNERTTAPASASYPSLHTTFDFPGPYRAYAASPVGKLFFVQNGRNWVCSGSLIGYKYVVTAGHCVSDGNGHWSTNVMFCPSYNGGVDPERGCWTTNTVVSSVDWHNSQDWDMDIGLAVYGNTGTKINDYPGNAVGWFGYAWNWGIVDEMMFGYPTGDRGPSSNNPRYNFDGNIIWVTTGDEAGYTIDWGAGYDSKYLGTVQTPGCSGGPWILGWGKKDVDVWNTNWVNGVNSSQRCYDANPPCNDRYQEISSPPFNKTGTNGVCGPQGCGVVDIIEWGFSQYP
jgi:hypothetical protein